MTQQTVIVNKYPMRYYKKFKSRLSKQSTITGNAIHITFKNKNV